MRLVTADDMRAQEAASEAAGVSTDTLMENAGLAVARRVRDALGGAAGKRVVVLVGPGNNGGDGLVAAGWLARWGADVSAILVRSRRSPDPKADLAREAGVGLETVTEPGRLAGPLARADAVIDAVLGTGRGRALEGPFRDAMLAVSEAKRARRALLVVALDLPTGVDADTGAADPASPACDLTLTLGFPKVGLYQGAAVSLTGRIEVLDIGIPASVGGAVRRELMDAASVRGLVPGRPAEGHKGTFGTALVVAGSRWYVGAAALTAQAAGRVGAGLVTIASPSEVQMALAARVVEATHLPLPCADGAVTPDAADLVLKQAASATALILGCGLSQSEATRLFTLRVLDGLRDVPAVVDADGLNNLSLTKDWRRFVHAPLVLTPHPGEMGRLAGLPAKEVNVRRLDLASEKATEWGVTLVLKGAHTVVAAADGRAAVSPFANPALASGGTGDVLAGTIGGLLAQGMAPFDAARLGVFVHALAGERVRAELGEAGLLAGDLLPWLPRALTDLRLGHVAEGGCARSGSGGHAARRGEAQPSEG